MDTLGIVLLVASLAYLAVLVVIEVRAVIERQPTISDRMRDLATAAPIARNLALIVAGYMVAHFWDRS